jgi:hypothetical protein
MAPGQRNDISDFADHDRCGLYGEASWQVEPKLSLTAGVGYATTAYLDLASVRRPGRAVSARRTISATVMR